MAAGRHRFLQVVAWQLYMSACMGQIAKGALPSESRCYGSVKLDFARLERHQSLRL